MFIYAPKVILVSALSTLVTGSAMPNIARGGSTGTTCPNGSLQCCSQTIAVNQTSVDLTRFGVNETVSVAMGSVLGIQCSTVNVVGVQGGCTQQILCCGGTLFSGLVDVNCTVVNISV